MLTFARSSFRDWFLQVYPQLPHQYLPGGFWLQTVHFVSSRVVQRRHDDDMRGLYVANYSDIATCLAVLPRFLLAW